MARIGLTEAAKLTGKSASTITRRSNHKDQKKRLSFTTNDDGERQYDVAELERVFGNLVIPDSNNDAPVQKSKNAIERNNLHEDLKAAHEREIALLREQNALLQAQVQDAQKDRDEWRSEAKQRTLQIEDHRNKTQKLETELEELKNPPQKPEEPRKGFLAWFLRN
ncbi:MAG: hypothetical protein AAFY76_03830 [Cyanobacteria bacterium J06649_11]